MKNVNSSVNYAFKYVCTVCDYNVWSDGQLARWCGPLSQGQMGRLSGSASSSSLSTPPSLSSHTHTLNLMAVCVRQRHPLFLLVSEVIVDYFSTP